MASAWGGSWGGSWNGSWGSGPPPIPPDNVTPPVLGGGGIPYQSPRSRSDISKARKRLGLEDDYKEVIQEVAKRQVDRLETDKQKQFDELSRELKLRNIEFEGRYLEALNLERERLIDLEISARLKAKMRQDDEDIMAIMIGLASSI